ncbi:MAG: phosphoribosyltransferase family protein [Actinomycetota bacterium]
MIRALLDLACPRRCPGCGERGVLLCAECTGGVLGVPFRADPTPRPAGLPQVFAATAYDGPARAALIAFKERGRLALAGPLGAALAGVVAGMRADFVVAVPSSRAARRERGYDHMSLLAKQVAALTGVPIATGLGQHRRVADQSGLDSAGRARNITGSMRYAARRGCQPNGRVVLLDDIVTSGATLLEATRALRAAGIEVSAAAVVAATQRRFQDRAPSPFPPVRDSLGP